MTARTEAMGEYVDESAPLERLAAALSDRIDAEVRFDAGACGAYSTDASNFRQVPLGVVIPRTVDAGAEAIRLCRDHDTAVLSRGGGTSLAGQCMNAAVVVDWTKHCDGLLDLDVRNRTCVVEPGIVLDDLNRQLGQYGLRFGPEPATHMNCTIGGMIGNNSCGATAQRTGKVVDNIVGLDVLTYDGARFVCGRTSDEEYRDIERRGDRRAEVYRSLRRIRDAYASTIRETYPDIPRRVSGYNLDSLLPENGFDVAGALVGSESTLVTVLHAELALVTVPSDALCCGLTWISTGQLDKATTVLRRTVADLSSHVRAGGYVVGLEPSCTTVFRSDAPDLLGDDDPDVARLRDQTVTLAELLTEHSPGWTAPAQPRRLRALAQVHCHQHAVLGWDADARLLEAVGFDVERLDSGCCGLAGNFGFTAGHGEVSEACAERVMLPRIREADDSTVVLADGFSCRTQIHQLSSDGREAVHLAELLAGSYDGSARPPESTLADRPRAPGGMARLAAGTGVLAGGVLVGAATVRALRVVLRR